MDSCPNVSRPPLPYWKFTYGDCREGNFAGFSRLRERLWQLSKQDRDRAKEAARDFAEALIWRYPSLAPDDESEGDSGRWFAFPPPRDSPLQYGPITGQIRDLARWLERDERTLKKHSGRAGYYITKDHGRQFSVWFSSASQLENVQRRRQSEST